MAIISLEEKLVLNGEYKLFTRQENINGKPHICYFFVEEEFLEKKKTTAQKLFNAKHNKSIYFKNRINVFYLSDKEINPEYFYPELGKQFFDDNYLDEKDLESINFQKY